jgi:hypothetical protein
VLARVQKGDVLEVVKTTDDWLWVNVPGQDRPAWIGREFVESITETPSESNAYSQAFQWPFYQLSALANIMCLFASVRLGVAP